MKSQFLRRFAEACTSLSCSMSSWGQVCYKSQGGSFLYKDEYQNSETAKKDLMKPQKCAQKTAAYSTAVIFFCVVRLHLKTLNKEVYPTNISVVVCVLKTF